MRDGQPLSARQEMILSALCREYIVTGRPVPSSALSRAKGLSWSSATIRNELVSLEEAGLVCQPHQSAGRIPSARGIALYIGSLPLAAPSPALRRAVDCSLPEGMVTSDGMRATTRVLSDLVGCVAVAFVGETRRGVLRRIELVAMQGPHALVVLTLDDGCSWVEPVLLDSRLLEGSDSVALARLEERLRALCLDKTLVEARAHLSHLLAAQEARLDRWLAESLRIGLWLCAAASFEPLWLQVAGQRMLASQAASGGVELLGQILGLLEDYHQLAELLCQLLPEPGAQVRLGSELALALGGDGAALHNMSLVGCRLAPSLEGGRTGAVALLGPDRMDYEAVIPLVEYAAQRLAARTS